MIITIFYDANFYVYFKMLFLHIYVFQKLHK